MTYQLGYISQIGSNYKPDGRIRKYLHLMPWISCSLSISCNSLWILYLQSVTLVLALDTCLFVGQIEKIMENEEFIIV